MAYDTYQFSVNYYDNSRRAKQGYYTYEGAREIARILSIEKRRAIEIRAHTLQWYNDAGKIWEIWENGRRIARLLK